MTFRSSVLYASRLIFPRSSGPELSQSHGRKSLMGALACIGISLVPLVAVLVISEGMIQGITGRIIRLSSQDLQVYVDANSPYAASEENLLRLSGSLSEVRGVTGAYPEITGSALAVGEGYRSGANVRAVLPDIFSSNDGFSSLFSVVEGETDLSAAGNAVIGQKIAELLSLHAGDSLMLVTVRKTGGRTYAPKVSRFTVRGIVSCGYQELDALSVFIPLEAGFTSLDKSSSEHLIGITTDRTFSPELHQIRLNVQDHLLSLNDGGAVYGAWVSSWQEINVSQFENFSSTRILLLLIMILIVLVASVNISSALVMLVMERRREIAILKSVGATPGGITASFLMAGFVCGLGGVLLGLPAGLLVSVNINQVISCMESIVNLGGRFAYMLVNGSGDGFSAVHILSPEFYLQEIPVSIPFKELFIIVLMTLFLSLAMSAIPAVSAGKEKPLDTLRKM